MYLYYVLVHRTRTMYSYRTMYYDVLDYCGTSVHVSMHRRMWRHPQTNCLFVGCFGPQPESPIPFWRTTPARTRAAHTHTRTHTCAHACGRATCAAYTTHVQYIYTGIYIHHAAGRASTYYVPCTRYEYEVSGYIVRVQATRYIVQATRYI